MVAFEFKTELVIQNLIHLPAPGFRTVLLQTVLKKTQEWLGVGWSGKDIHPWKTFFEGVVAVDTDETAHQTNYQVGVGSF